MRRLLWAGAALAFVASVLVARVVVHGYTDHGHLDVFHLVVATVAASVGAVLVWRALHTVAQPSNSGDWLGR